MSRSTTKPTKWHLSAAKTQISLGIRPVWSEPSLFALWVAKDPNFLQEDNENSDQTGQIEKADLSLRWAHSHLLGFVMSWLILCI